MKHTYTHTLTQSTPLPLLSTMCQVQVECQCGLSKEGAWSGHSSGGPGSLGQEDVSTR